MKALHYTFATLTIAGPAVVVSAIAGAAIGIVPIDAAASIFAHYLHSGIGLVSFIAGACWALLDYVTR